MDSPPGSPDRSQLSADGMRDSLHDHGIADPAMKAQVMRDIARYHNYLMQRDHPQLYEDLPPIKFPEANLPRIIRHPGPGDPDLLLTCRVCKETKRAGDNFYHRNDTENGWGRKCKDCIVKPPGPRRNEQGRFADDMYALPAAEARGVHGSAEAASVQGSAEDGLVQGAGRN